MKNLRASKNIKSESPPATTEKVIDIVGTPITLGRTKVESDVSDSQSDPEPSTDSEYEDALYELYRRL